MFRSSLLPASRGALRAPGNVDRAARSATETLQPSARWPRPQPADDHRQRLPRISSSSSSNSRSNCQVSGLLGGAAISARSSDGRLKKIKMTHLDHSQGHKPEIIKISSWIDIEEIRSLTMEIMGADLDVMKLVGPGAGDLWASTREEEKKGSNLD